MKEKLILIMIKVKVNLNFGFNKNKLKIIKNNLKKFNHTTNNFFL